MLDLRAKNTPFLARKGISRQNIELRAKNGCFAPICKELMSSHIKKYLQLYQLCANIQYTYNQALHPNISQNLHFLAQI